MKYYLLFAILFIGIKVSYAQVPTIGLIAYYPFDGNVNDQTVNAYNLVGTNVTYSPDRFGRVNRAGNFNGISSYADRAPFSLLDSFSISVWSKANSLPAAEMILTNGSSGTDGISLIVGDGGSPAGIGDTIIMFMGGVGVANHPAVAKSYWQNTVIIYKSGTYSVYENDTLVASGSITMLTPSSQFIVGASKNGSLIKEYFSGLVDDIRIYSRPLTTSEVSALYHEMPVDVPVIASTEVSVNIYPNPASNELTFQFTNTNKTSVNIQLFNSIGQLIFEKDSKQNINTIDVSKLPSGIYIAKISSNGQTTFRKVLKE